MPGVPKSRGCEACRKVRKKCDQARPSCSRCSRLKIACAGAGVQRFVFVDEAVPKDETRRLVQNNRRKLGRSSNQVIQEMPPNALESLTALMASKISVKDPRYDVGWAYGPFMTGIPKRLGHNVALDAATEAFVLSLPPSSHHRKHPDSSVLQSYIVALEATRIALADPVQSRKIDTLCAAYFLLVCQDRIGVPGDTWVHVVGINHMLNDPRSTFDASNDFDMSLIVLLCSIISGEIFLDTTLEIVPFSPCWKSFNLHIAQSVGPLQKDDPGLGLEGMISNTFKHLSKTLHTVRPMSEAKETFESMCSIVRACRERWHETADLSPTSTKPSTNAFSSPLFFDPSVAEDNGWGQMRTHLRNTRSYCIAITLTLIQSIILRMYVPDTDGEVARRSWNLFAEVVWLGKHAAQFKPLGNTFMADIFETVYAVGEFRSKLRMEPALSFQGVDFDLERAADVSKKLNNLLEPLRERIAAQYPEAASPSPGTHECGDQHKDVQDCLCQQPERPRAHFRMSNAETGSMHRPGGIDGVEGVVYVTLDQC